MGKMGVYIERLIDYSGLRLISEYRKALKKPDAVFIWIPKTAGTSLVDLLDASKLKSMRYVKCRFMNRGVVTFGHIDYLALLRKGYINYSFHRRAFKFCVVRNPFDRAVSLYHFLQREGRIPQEYKFLDFARLLAERGCEPIGLYHVKGLSQCNPQVRWMEGVSLDFVGRFESLVKDTEKILRRLSINGRQLPHLNATRHDDYRAYYCRESEEIIRQFYAEDFKHLGYATRLCA